MHHHLAARRTTVHPNAKKTVLWRISTFRRCFRSYCSRFRSCWMLKASLEYRHYHHPATPSPAPTAVYSSSSQPPAKNHVVDHAKDSSDLVTLKISLFGDPHIGKTTFLTRYVGEDQGKKDFAATGINQVDKTLEVKGARISYSVWEVGGDDSSRAHIPAACKDSVAMLFMFDLTSRCTLNSVITWYREARKRNKTAIPVLIGTKFDEFVQLPPDLQWTIAKEARSYAKAFKATLFFSSATYNINVNKIFKFITAKLFNLNWNLERNLTIGEPIIDF